MENGCNLNQEKTVQSFFMQIKLLLFVFKNVFATTEATLTDMGDDKVATVDLQC